MSLDFESSGIEQQTSCCFNFSAIDNLQRRFGCNTKAARFATMLNKKSPKKLGLHTQ